LSALFPQRSFALQCIPGIGMGDRSPFEFIQLECRSVASGIRSTAFS
jgi:hypothetical protein